MKDESDIRIVEMEEIKVERPIVILGVPDVGLVGSIATSHMVSSMNMVEVGYVDSEILPPVMLVHKSRPKAPLRIFGAEKFLVVTTQVAVGVEAMRPLAKSIIQWAGKHNAQLTVGITGLAMPNRIDIEKPAVYGLGTTDELRRQLKDGSVQMLEEGVLIGMYALLLKECMHQGQPNLTLLAESHLQFPDPGASAAAIETLNTMLHLNVDVKKLLESAEEIRIKMRELMRRTHEQMRGMGKVQEQELPGIYV